VLAIPNLKVGHELLSYCRQIVTGLEYLSKKLFVHKDLAAKNILLSDNYIFKVILKVYARIIVYQLI